MCSRAVGYWCRAHMHLASQPLGMDSPMDTHPNSGWTLIPACLDGHGGEVDAVSLLERHGAVALHGHAARHLPNAGKTEQGVSQGRVCLLSPAGNHARWSAGRPAERPAERRHGTATFFHFVAAAHLVQRVGAAGQQGGLLKLAGAGHLDLRGVKEEQDGRRTT